MGHTLAIALCATLLATAPRASLTDSAGASTAPHARALISHHSPRLEPSRHDKMTMRGSISLHTITRRSTALNTTSHMIAMRTPDCLLDGMMPRI